MANEEGAIVVLYHTIVDGPVLRWYRSVAAAEAARHYMSAGCNGVHIDGYLHEIPIEQIATAKQVYEELARDRRADVSRFATHHKPLLAGRIVPISREEVPS